MNVDIKLHKLDLPDDLAFSDKIAIDCEFMGLNVERDALCLVQISTGKKDAHIIQLNRETYNAPKLKKILSDKNMLNIFIPVGFAHGYCTLTENTEVYYKCSRYYNKK